VLSGSVAFDGEELARVLKLSPLPEPPADPTNAVATNEAAAHLGQWLFFDRRLSANGEVSCATCHDYTQGFSDGKQVASAIGELRRNSLTLWNVAYNRWFFWDGRADSTWAQALSPWEDPREHGGSRAQFAHLVREDADLRRAYEGVFGALPDLSDPARFPRVAKPAADPEDPAAKAWAAMSLEDRETVDRIFSNLGKSVAAYERRLLSRHSPFDRFVEGVRGIDAAAQAAYPDEARRGLKLFLGKARCHVCHAGPNFTDKEFHNTRAPLIEGRTNPDPARYDGIEKVLLDPFNAAGRFSDDPAGPAREKLDYLVRLHHTWNEYKTPTLRNVATNPPYMHEGVFASLEEVVRFYSTLEGALGKHLEDTDQTLVAVHLNEEEIQDLVRFLESLTDVDIDPALVVAPEKPYPRSP
jgi:cytochrome c peroxidase